MRTAESVFDIFVTKSMRARLRDSHAANGIDPRGARPAVLVVVVV
jgi:hypothetical protein